MTIDYGQSKIPDFCRALDHFDHVRASTSGQPGEMPASPFEHFMAQRLGGSRDHGPILDRVSLSTAIDLCEIIGMAARYGRKFRIRGSGETELRHARAQGFLALSAAEHGLFDVLDKLVVDRSRSYIRGGYAIYGDLYFKLAQSPRGSEYDEVRALLRRHATERLAMLPGSVVFERLGEVGWTSINQIVKQVGLHPNTVQKYLSEHHRLSARKGLEAEEFVDADVAEQAVAALSDTISLPEAAGLLGWSIHDCRRLVRLNILLPSVSGSGLKPRYAKALVLDLKARLVANATADPSELVSLDGLSKTLASGHDDVLRAAFDGRLKTLAYTDGESLRLGLKVCLPEVLSVPLEVSVTPKVVCQALSLEPDSVYRMVNIGVFPTADRVRRTIPAADLADFRRRFVSSAQIKREHGLKRTEFDKLFRRAGIEPAFPIRETGQMILHRADLLRLFESG